MTHTRTTVSARLEAAVDVLHRLRNPIGPNGYKGNWPDILRDHVESYGYNSVDTLPPIPSAKEIDDMDRVMEWFMIVGDEKEHKRLKRLYNHSDYMARRILLDRHKVLVMASARKSYRKIAKDIGKSHEGVRRIHKMAIDRLVERLNGR